MATALPPELRGQFSSAELVKETWAFENLILGLRRLPIRNA